ncbi:MAG: hypothetical protein U0871_15260 [Gemmataceae bacterium]
MERKGLREAVRNRADKLGYSLDRVADMVGIHGGTLRSQLYRGAFPVATWDALCRVLWETETPEEVAGRLGVSFARKRRSPSGLEPRSGPPAAGDLLRKISIQDQRIKQLRVTETLLTYAESLTRGDFYAYTSLNREPYETVVEHRQPLAARRVTAVLRGAISIYLLPERDAALQARLKRYRAWVVEHLVSDHEVESDRAKQLVEDGILVLPLKKCDLWYPNFSFGFHQACDSKRIPQQRVSVRLPDDFSSEIIHSDQCGTLTKLFYAILIEAIHDAVARSANSKRRKRLEQACMLIQENWACARLGTPVDR